MFGDAVEITMKHDEMKRICIETRRNIVRMAHEKKMSHVGSAFSMVEILVTLYLDVLNIDPSDAKSSQRDVFILSKGHACIALYNVLAFAGFFPVERLKTYCEFDGGMGGHPDRHILPGIEACTGSLGHGLSLGVGLAIAGKHDKQNRKVVVLMGDGELDEGSVWEAAMAASHYKLDNMIAIVDRNGLQADSRTEETMALESLEMKWKSFGWHAEQVDGHNLCELSNVLGKLYNMPGAGSPNVVIARTVKGKGVSFMEDEQAWHFNVPDEKEMNRALEELA